MRCQVDLGIVIAIKQPRLLREQVAHCQLIALILKEGFIASYYLSVLFQSMAHPSPQLNDALDAIGGEERIAENLVGVLANTINTTHSLDQADNGPRQIVVHDDCAVLQVLSLTEDIGCNQDSDFSFVRDLVLLVVADRTETPGQLRWVCRVARNARMIREPTCAELIIQIANRIGKLGEDENLVGRMLIRQQINKRIELCIPARVPSSVLLEKSHQFIGIRLEVLLELLHKQGRLQPTKLPRLLLCVDLIHCGSTLLECIRGIECGCILGGFLFEQVVACSRRVLVVQARVEQFGTLGTDGQWKTMFDRMQVDVIAENMPLDRLDEGHA